MIFESFQAGYLKPLDYDLCMGLRNSTAKRMYRFLDKRFHHKPDWTFDLKELAHEHIGLGRNYEGPAHLKRNLQPAIDELEAVGFLEPLAESDRFQKDGKDWKVRLIQKAGMVPALPASQHRSPNAGTPCPCRGTGQSWRHQGDGGRAGAEAPGRIHPVKLDVFDWLMEKQDKRVAKSPAGYLVKSINDDYAAPKGFVSREPSGSGGRKPGRPRNARPPRSAAAKQEAEAREQAEQKAIDAYWASLTPEQQAELDAAALADRLSRPSRPSHAEADEPPARCSGYFAISFRRHAYIRQLVAGREQTRRLPCAAARRRLSA